MLPILYDDEVINVIASRCGEVESGARVVDAILTNTVLPKISQEFLTRMMEGKTIERVQVSVKEGEFMYGFE
jgi:type VI secretion system protein VasG